MGLQPHCKPCEARRHRDDPGRHARVKAYRKANRERLENAAKAWARANKERRNAAQRARVAANQEAVREWMAQWYLQNKERVSEAGKAWRKANPDKIRAKTARRRAWLTKSQTNFTAADVLRLYEEQSGLCRYCFVQLGHDYHVDHVIPLSRGGSNGPENICLSCPSCNLKKAARLPSELTSASSG
jgi:5-methylcytosine-specific restriction endonuclease McrA